MKNWFSSTSFVLVSALSLGCAPDAPTTYTVGGDISNLSGTLELSNNDDPLTVTDNGIYTFNTALVDESNYDVNIEEQPIGQSCTINNNNGEGTITGVNVTTIDISCVDTGVRLPVQQISSTYTGLTYDIYVYLPIGYDEGVDDLPVMYTLDGEFQFGTNANVLDEKQKDVVLISIGNMGISRRSVDYVLPGAEAYFDFVTLELIPAMEAQYRIDADQRTLVGHSLAGLFVGVGMLLDEPGNRFFSSYVAQDGAFLVNETEIIAFEQQMYNTTQQLPVTLILGAATSDPAAEWSLYDHVVWFRDLLTVRSYTGLNMIFMEYEEEHVGQLFVSAPDAIDILYP
jgi:predicted alpha/beta superfamily hydrolase